MVRVSYSRYSTWKQCKRRFKHTYLDDIPMIRVGNESTIFGTAMHETVQHYLTVMYTDSKRKADEMDLNKLLLKKMKEEFLKAKTQLLKSGHQDVNLICSQEALSDAYKDGIAILKWFKNPKNQNKFYSKRGYRLVGIELPIELQLREGLTAIGFIDVIIENVKTGRITIIDIKTSKKGWGKWQKKSDDKKNQIRLYKKWYSDQYGVNIDKIDVEFHIMRRKIDPESEFPIPRMSSFKPSHGSRSIKMAENDFNAFLDFVYNDDGTVKEATDERYEKTPGPLCDWCDFYGKYCDGQIGT